jgi:hypothetical protein
MANATNPGSGSEVDIEGHVLTAEGTIVVQWCRVWPELHRGETRWVGSPSCATELRVTVTGRGRGASSWDVEVDILSDSVPADVHAKLVEYAIAEEDNQWRLAVAS